MLHFVSSFAATGCGPGGGRRDTGSPAVEEAGPLDAPLDATPETALEASVAPDVGLDAPFDAPPDVAADVPADAPVDTPSDARADAPADASVDALADAPAETSSPFASTCMMPVRSIVNGDEIVGHATGPSRELGHGCSPSTPGPEDYFTLYNGSPSRWFLSTDDPRTDADTVIAVREACSDPTSESDCGDDLGTRTGTTALTFSEFTRRGLAVIVDRKDGTGPFNYVLHARQVPLATNSRCLAPSSRVVSANGANLAGENLEGSNSHSGSCGALDNVTQLYYRTTVPPHTQTAVTVTPTGPMPTDVWTPYIRAGHSCDVDCTEIARARSRGAPATALLVNDESAPREFWFSVSTSEGYVFGTYRINTVNGPIADGDSCARPELLSTSSPLAGRLTDRNDSISFGCDAVTAGGQSWYSIEVPAGRRMRVTVTPGGDEPWSALLRHADTCPELRCLGASASSGPGMPVEYTFTNAGSSSRAFLFAVSSRTGGAHPYDVAAEQLTGSVPYVESLVPASCDALPTDAPPALGSPADDVTTPVAALPFAFTFFGQRATHYALSSNGFVQLFTGATATPVAAPATRALPDPAAPPGIIAPYWSDLAARFPGGELRTATVSDAAGRRFVAHWSSYQRRGATAGLLSFQVKLFESSGAVELHYCTLSDSIEAGLIQGAYSTTGMQDPSGIEGLTYARNARSSLSTTRAIRYEPRP